MTKSIPSLSKMWLKILNFNTTLFPALQEEIGVLSSKEEKLMRILDFAEIEKFISEVKITNPLNIVKRLRERSLLKLCTICKHTYVKGATKVASHLMFGVLALCIHQSIKLLT